MSEDEKLGRKSARYRFGLASRADRRALFVDLYAGAVGNGSDTLPGSGAGALPIVISNRSVKARSIFMRRWLHQGVPLQELQFNPGEKGLEG
jgi:hypothetical protein